MDRWNISDEEILAQAEAARRRGTTDRLNAIKVRYRPRGRMLEVTLRNDVVLGVPVDLIESLAPLGNADLAKVRIQSGGWALEWPALDIDFTIAAMVYHVMGRRVIMSASGRIAGSVKSEAKAIAARRNGLKGGRPKKAARRATAATGPKKRAR